MFTYKNNKHNRQSTNYLANNLGHAQAYTITIMRDNTNKKGFKKLLARCMAKALFSHAKKRQGSDGTALGKDAYLNTVKRLEYDILNESDFSE